MDLFNTFARIAGLKVPEGRIVDGIDLTDALLSGTEFDRPVFFYRGNLLFAVRSGPYKMHLWTWTTPQSELDQVPVLKRTFPAYNDPTLVLSNLVGY